MATPEQSSFADIGTKQAEEILDPRHFYAACVFEYATLRGHDVAVLLDQAYQFECPVRYWWDSETTNLTGALDRLIVRVHHPSLNKAVAMHGILRQAAARHQVVWDEFDAAKLDEYRRFGKIVVLLKHLRARSHAINHSRLRGPMIGPGQWSAFCRSGRRRGCARKICRMDTEEI